MSTSIIRGRTLTFNRKPNSINDAESYNYIEDGAILIQDGTIKKIGSFKDIKKHSPKDIKIYDHTQQLLIPGFVDAHLHFPQIQLVGSYAANSFRMVKKLYFY